MASTPACGLHPEHPATYVIGSIETGEQLFLCDEGTAHFGLTLALQTLDPAEIINAAQALKATPVNGDTAEAPANKPARKRAPKAAKPKPTPDNQPGGAEVPA